MGIVSIGSKLLKTVRLLVVHLTKIRIVFCALKNQCFGCHTANKCQSEECHTPLSSLFNFQTIVIQTWTFFIAKIGQHINCF